VQLNGPESRRPITIRRGIFGIYGWTGVLMVVAFLLSGTWTLALAVVQLAPSAVANYLMDTAELDLGDFWTLQKADDTIATSAAALLLAFAMVYFGFVIEMARLSATQCGRTSRRIRSVVVDPVNGPAPVSFANPCGPPPVNNTGTVTHSTSENSAGSTDQRRKLWRSVRGRVIQVAKLHGVRFANIFTAGVVLNE
jgi:hypothetical protein